MSPLAISTRFLQTQPDVRLLELSRDGHERAFEALVNRYRRQLLAYCRRLAGRGPAAEDVLQQALLQAWLAINAGAEIRDLRAWLHRIVHNVAVSQTRRVRPEPADQSERAQATRGADAEVEQRLALRAALAGLAALPELQRQAIVGTVLDGLSHQEMADALGLSQGAVRGLIYRARTTLRAAAAALTPGPLVSWIARRGGSSGGIPYETLAGGGSAGMAPLLIKGGAIVASAGVLATAGLHEVRHTVYGHPHQPRHAQLVSNAGARGVIALASEPSSAYGYGAGASPVARLGAGGHSRNPRSLPVAHSASAARGSGSYRSSSSGSPTSAGDGPGRPSGGSDGGDRGGNSGAGSRHGSGTDGHDHHGDGGSGVTSGDGGSSGGGSGSSSSDGESVGSGGGSAGSDGGSASSGGGASGSASDLSGSGSGDGGSQPSDSAGKSGNGD